MPTAVTNPFTPRKAAGSYWNTTIEAPDRLLQGPGNVLSGNPAAAAVTAATNAAGGTTAGTTTTGGTTPGAPDWAGGIKTAVTNMFLTPTGWQRGSGITPPKPSDQQVSGLTSGLQSWYGGLSAADQAVAAAGLISAIGRGGGLSNIEQNAMYLGLTPEQQQQRMLEASPNIASWQPGGANYEARMYEIQHYNDPENVAARAAAAQNAEDQGQNWASNMVRTNPMGYLSWMRGTGQSGRPPGYLGESTTLFKKLYGFDPWDYSKYDSGGRQGLTGQELWAFLVAENKDPTVYQTLTPATPEKRVPIRRPAEQPMVTAPTQA